MRDRSGIIINEAGEAIINSGYMEANLRLDNEGAKRELKRAILRRAKIRA